MLKISELVLNVKKENLLSIGELTIGSGELVNLIGPNQSGKSLLFKAIHGEYFSFSGEINIKEKPAIFYKKRKQTVLVENQSHLLYDETVWNNIILPFTKLNSHMKMKISELCIIAEIDEKLKMKVRTLSFSEQKFVEIIRAVAQLPYIVLIDDIDNFFDEINFAKALEIINFAIISGSSVFISSKKRLLGVDNIRKIQDCNVVKL